MSGCLQTVGSYYTRASGKPLPMPGPQAAEAVRDPPPLAQQVRDLSPLAQRVQDPSPLARRGHRPRGPMRAPRRPTRLPRGPVSLARGPMPPLPDCSRLPEFHQQPQDVGGSWWRDMVAAP